MAESKKLHKNLFIDCVCSKYSNFPIMINFTKKNDKRVV